MKESPDRGLAAVQRGQALPRVAPGSSNAVYAVKEDFSDPKHERDVSPRGLSATFGVRNMIEVAADPTTAPKLRVCVMRIMSMRFDKVDVVSVGEWRPVGEPDLFVPKDNIVKELG